MPDGAPPHGLLRPPYPGSDEAVERGCTCPVFDNHRGKGFGDGMYYITPDCPVHDPPDAFKLFEPEC